MSYALGRRVLIIADSSNDKVVAGKKYAVVITHTDSEQEAEAQARMEVIRQFGDIKYHVVRVSKV